MFKKQEEYFRSLIQNGEYKEVRHVIRNDPSIVQRCDLNGDFPIHHVCRENVSLGIAELIFDAGASLNTENNDGERPIEIACNSVSGNLDVALDLIHRGVIMTQADLDADLLSGIYFETPCTKNRKPRRSGISYMGRNYDFKPIVSIAFLRSSNLLNLHSAIKEIRDLRIQI